MSGRSEFGTGVGALVRITVGPIIWAVHFVVCYGLAAVWCAKYAAAGAGTLQVILIAATVVALVAIALSGWMGWRTWTAGGYGEDGAIPGIDDEESRERFLGHATVLLSVVSAIGVLYVAMPVLLLGSCR